MKITGKKVIIIGASSGIGRALAELLVSKGNIVGITGRRTALLQQLEDTDPHRIYCHSFDVTDTLPCAQHLDVLLSKMGSADILINCAGNGEINESLDFEVEKEMIALNVSGFTCIADWAFNYFKSQGYGHLVTISSVAGLRGSRQAPAYSASKAYQINYLEGLRQKARHEKSKIVITDIRPGFVDTPMAKSPVKFWVSPVDKAARQIYQALSKQKKVVYITRRWQLVAGLYRCLPARLHERM